MADDDGESVRPRLAQQLVMTPQLQMAIKLLATPAGALGTFVDQVRAEHPGCLRELAPGEAAIGAADGDELDLVFAEPPLPPVGGTPDVWVFGNPPQVRANPAAIPRFGLATDDPDAVRAVQWLARALRQRLRTYARVVGVLVAERPQLAIALSLDDIAPVPPRAIAEAIGMHESTIERVALGCTFQNLHGVFPITTLVRASRRKRT